MPSVAHAVTNFVDSIISVFFSLLNSVFAVFHAIFALGVDVVNSVLTVVRHLIALVTDLFSGVLGFVAGERYGISYPLLLALTWTREFRRHRCPWRSVLRVHRIPVEK